MSDRDETLRQTIQKESDEIMFSQIDLNDKVKQAIRKKAAAEKPGNSFRLSKSWIIGSAAAIAAAVLIFVGIPMLQEPAVPAPSENSASDFPPVNEGSVGSELSSLTTIPLASEEDAKEAFGPDLLVPSYVPEGFSLAEMVAVGMEGEPARDVIFTYLAGEKTVTFVASRDPASFPTELFTPTQVNGVDGFVFEQPELIELFWVDDGIQYSITGPLSTDEALKLAASSES